TFPEGNVVLLVDKKGAPPASETDDGKNWDRNRHVMVIYASDKPFSWDAIQNATPHSSLKEEQFVGLINRYHSTTSVYSAVANFGLGIHTELNRPPVVHTFPIPAERLKPFTDREPGVVLTDQFCPIDNLMAEVFRNR